MKKVLIVEDDPLIADSLEIIVEASGYECVGKTYKVEETLIKVADVKPDLLLLDINLRGNQEGLDIAEIIYKREKIPFIFITAYSDEKTVNRGAESEPMGYIIKPFSQADVRVALKLAFASIEKREKKMMPLIEDDTYYIKDKTGYRKVMISEINYVQADDIYCILVTNNHRYVVSKSLKKIEVEFESHGFIRVHRSYLVNRSAVDQIIDGQVVIGKESIPIGRVYREELIKQLKIL
ncbi:MAG: response regulator [Reichenbachiella sp.]|uniref:LytR/AlgR family response regulator transcription factor n=1 Tax=Reichenbachiella sp. TaxID=2184521 RepID=UPI00329A18B1